MKGTFEPLQVNKTKNAWCDSTKLQLLPGITHRGFERCISDAHEGKQMVETCWNMLPDHNSQKTQQRLVMYIEKPCLGNLILTLKKCLVTGFFRNLAGSQGISINNIHKGWTKCINSVSPFLNHDGPCDFLGRYFHGIITYHLCDQYLAGGHTQWLQ